MKKNISFKEFKQKATFFKQSDFINCANLKRVKIQDIPLNYNDEIDMEELIGIYKKIGIDWEPKEKGSDKPFYKLSLCLDTEYDYDTTNVKAIIIGYRQETSDELDKRIKAEWLAHKKYCCAGIHLPGATIANCKHGIKLN